MKQLIFLRNLFLFSIIAYFAQGSLYPQGSVISQLFYVIITIISIYFFVKTLLLKSKKSLFFYIWTGLLLVNFFGFFFTGDISNKYQFSMLKGITFTLLIFYPIYFFAKKDILSSRELSFFLYIITPLFILQFILNQNAILSARISDKTDVVNNVAYFFVGLIPFVFLVRKKLLSFIIMLVLIYYIIISAKRGALVAGVLGLILFMYYNLKTIDDKNRIKGYLSAFIVICGVTYFSYDLYINNPYLIERMESVSEGGLSGRDTIFSNIYNAWLGSENMLNILFGYGFAASLVLSGTGNFAHNDWLEMLSNFGFFGFLLFLLLFYSFLSFILNKKLSLNNKIIGITVLLICFINTIVYRFYSGGDGFLYSIMFAYLLGNSKNLHDNNNSLNNNK